MFGIKTVVLKKTSRTWLWLSFGWALFTNYLKSPPSGGRQILVTLGDWRKNEDIPKNLYSIFRFLCDAGCGIYVYRKVDFKFYDWLRIFGRQMFLIKHLKFVTSIPRHAESMIYMFDHENLDEMLLSRKWAKLVYVSIRKPETWDIGAGAIDMPYPMFPLIRRSNQPDNLGILKRRPRRIKVFFGGTTSRTYYRNPVLKNHNQMTRRGALAALLLARRRQIVHRPDKRQFYGLINGKSHQNKCVIINFYKFKIQPEQWLDAVSKSDFFLCLSGADYPMCHHLIESMAVGTIPIMSYPEWMNPPLEHGKNALLYRNKAELIQRFDEAMSMSSDRVEQMRRNVIRYYEEYLTPASFLPKFEAFPGPHTLGLERMARDSDPNTDQRLALNRLQERVMNFSLGMNKKESEN